VPGQNFTRKANTPKKRRQWDHVYQSVKSRGGSAASAVIQANGVLKKRGKKRGKSR